MSPTTRLDSNLTAPHHPSGPAERVPPGPRATEASTRQGDTACATSGFAPLDVAPTTGSAASPAPPLRGAPAASRQPVEKQSPLLPPPYAAATPAHAAFLDQEKQALLSDERETSPAPHERPSWRSSRLPHALRQGVQDLRRTWVDGPLLRQRAMQQVERLLAAAEREVAVGNASVAAQLYRDAASSYDGAQLREHGFDDPFFPPNFTKYDYKNACRGGKDDYLSAALRSSDAAETIVTLFKIYHQRRIFLPYEVEWRRLCDWKDEASSWEFRQFRAIANAAARGDDDRACARLQVLAEFRQNVYYYDPNFPRRRTVGEMLLEDRYGSSTKLPVDNGRLRDCYETLAAKGCVRTLALLQRLDTDNRADLNLGQDEERHRKKLSAMLSTLQQQDAGADGIQLEVSAADALELLQLLAPAAYSRCNRTLTDSEPTLSSTHAFRLELDKLDGGLWFHLLVCSGTKASEQLFDLDEEGGGQQAPILLLKGRTVLAPAVGPGNAFPKSRCLAEDEQGERWLNLALQAGQGARGADGFDLFFGKQTRARLAGALRNPAERVQALAFLQQYRTKHVSPLSLKFALLGDAALGRILPADVLDWLEA